MDDTGKGLGLNILVAEDNQVNQLLMASLLKKLGHRFDLVGDGAAAVEAVQNTTYDVVLMDVQMPGVDGVEATHLIRALDGPAKETPVIALTANAMAGDRERYLAAGMNGYVSKPIDLGQLTAAIDSVAGA
jgi:CheY-like chemotaxis protein